MKVREEQLDQPGRVGASVVPTYDADAIGRWSERVARFMGTGRYLAIQTVIVVLWITINATVFALEWDPYPFILLNLVFSTQAAYAAPLILLAQNRQDTRERALAERDRKVNDRILSDTEFLSRELAAIRLRLEAVATTDELDDIREDLRLAVSPASDD
ncbi:MAG: DUF1003 domain-containing protein [Acidimicrobiales bacterium]